MLLSIWRESLSQIPVIVMKRKIERHFSIASWSSYCESLVDHMSSWVTKHSKDVIECLEKDSHEPTANNDHFGHAIDSMSQLTRGQSRF